jgi:hypothetical protein
MNDTPPVPPVPQPSKNSALAVWSLVLGILSLTLCALFAGIPAVICGHLASGRIKRSDGLLGGAGLALAGLVTGYVSIGFSLLVLPLLLAIAIPNFVKARAAAQRNASVGTRFSVPATVGLKGKPLPDLAPLGLTAADCPAGHPVLAVIIDAEQRPSRHALKLLADQADTFKQEGIAVVVLQTGAMADDAFAEWKQDAAVAFPIGSFKSEPEKARTAWGASALPWIILTDRAHRVVAEGFAPEEIDAKLQALPKP